MSITITSLANNAAASKTFAELFADRSTHEWINTDDSTSGVESKLRIYNQKQGKSRLNGAPVRRASVVASIKTPVSIQVNGSDRTIYEEMQVQLTLVKPELLTTLTETQMKDLLAFVKNAVSATVLVQLAQGQV